MTKKSIFLWENNMSFWLKFLDKNLCCTKVYKKLYKSSLMIMASRQSYKIVMKFAQWFLQLKNLIYKRKSNLTLRNHLRRVARRNRDKIPIYGTHRSYLVLYLWVLVGGLTRCSPTSRNSCSHQIRVFGQWYQINWTNGARIIDKNQFLPL